MAGRGERARARPSRVGDHRGDIPFDLSETEGASRGSANPNPASIPSGGGQAGGASRTGHPPGAEGPRLATPACPTSGIEGLCLTR